jgi:hypothetical protein
MKVYLVVVEYIYAPGRTVDSVFLSKEKAQEHCDDLNANGEDDFAEVLERTVADADAD